VCLSALLRGALLTSGSLAFSRLSYTLVDRLAVSRALRVSLALVSRAHTLSDRLAVSRALRVSLALAGAGDRLGSRLVYSVGLHCPLIHLISNLR
jgi:hypothetical protein